MAKIYISGNEPLVKEIITKSFPNYRGRKISIQTEEVINVRSCWDGGSRDYYHFIQIREDGELVSLGGVRSMSAFEEPCKEQISMLSVPNLIVVRHSIFCGKDMGIDIIIHPTMMIKGLSPGQGDLDLTDDEKKVLYYTRRYKNTYGGRTDIRRIESGLPVDRWKEAQFNLVNKRLLTKSFALTNNGRNVAVNLHY